MWRIEFNPNDLQALDAVLRLDYPELFGGEILTTSAPDIPNYHVRVTNQAGQVSMLIYELEIGRHEKSLIFWQGVVRVFKIKSKRK